MSCGTIVVSCGTIVVSCGTIVVSCGTLQLGYLLFYYNCKNYYKDSCVHKGTSKSYKFYLDLLGKKAFRNIEL